jgi:hypothetical protein
MTSHRRAAQLLVSSYTTLTDAIGRHMPSGPYRDFSAWAFSPGNPRQAEFLRLTGLTQLVKMNVTLLSGIVEDDHWPEVLRHAGLMNTYQVLEVISDNLALGLGSAVLDEAAGQRRALVSAVNRAMLAALTPGRSTPAVLLLAGQAQQVARKTSIFSQSLATTKYSAMALEFAQRQDDPPQALRELEFGVWPALVTEVEVCRDLVDSIAGTATSGLVRQGLADRYRAVDRTLFGEHLARFELAALGAQTILVSPTLAYLSGVLLEKLSRLTTFARVISDGTLSDTFATAALLVRLQNDMGTRLLRMAPVQQAAQVRRLQLAGDDVLTALSASAEDVVFTRLHKDVANQESNVALWHARRANTPAEAWDALADSLAYFAVIYAQHRARLDGCLAELDIRLGDRRASTMIERFVRFHEEMYSHSYTESVGEYAT